MKFNKNVLVLRYIFSDGTLKNLYSLNGKYILGKVEIYIYRKTDTLIEFDVNNIRHTCNIDEVNKTVEITKKALILNTDNAQEYTPTKDYHPATKKYVDSKFVMYESIETIYTIPMSEMQKCNNGTGRYVSSIDFDELFINHEKYIYYANYKDDTLIPVKYDSKYNRFATDVLDKTSDYNIILGFDLGTHMMYPFNSGSAGVKAYTFTNDLVIKRVPILDVNEVATKKYVDDKEDKILSLLNNNASIFKITLTDEEMNNLMSTIPGNYSILNSIEPSFIEDIVNNGYWDYNMIMFNDKLLLKINSIGSGGVSCINDMTIASINFVTINEHYTEFKDLPIVSVLELSLAVIELNGEKKVVFAFGNSREHQLINNYYLDELIKFDSQGNLVVTINGVSKTFVPKNEDV